MTQVMTLARSGRIAVAPGTIGVWTVALDQPQDVLARLEGVLSTDEIARADRFAFDALRRHFVVCRGVLRLLLAECLGVAPTEVAFEYGRRGKPALARVGGRILDFNVSHSAGVALVAVSGGGPVGVDIECRTRAVEIEQLSARFFSAEEAAELLALAPVDRSTGFFNCWTRKEAYIKAIGDGLACPLDSFAVTLRPNEPAAIRWITGDDAQAWRLIGFSPRTDYVAALATRWTPASVERCEWVAGTPEGWTSVRVPARRDDR